MCRFLVYKGKDEILLSKLILKPIHSILTQSYDSRLRLDLRRPHNGDGFGIGYYTRPALGPEPCIFTSTIPAWNCINLERLAGKTTSALIFAHVRATTEGTLADSNCHPFRRGRLMFMHNGNIGAWRCVKRALAVALGDRWFLGVQGGTDSEWAFALFLDTLERMGYDPDALDGAATAAAGDAAGDATGNVAPSDAAAQAASSSSSDSHNGGGGIGGGGGGSDGGFGHAVLREAMLETIRRINGFIAAIPDEVRAREGEALDTRSLLNFAVTDGQSVVCTRYVSSRTDEAASLFFSSGTSWKEHLPPGRYVMERRDKGADIVLVASEPLTFERDNWVSVPTNSILTIHKQTVLIHPIIDEYYNRSPSFTRSVGFAVSKGLVSHGPTSPVADGAVHTSPQPTTSLSPSSSSSSSSSPFSSSPHTTAEAAAAATVAVQ